MNDGLFDEGWTKIRGSAFVGDGKSYGILRTAKIKTLGNLGASLQHTFRERETPNADPVRLVDNRVLVGADTSREVMTRWHERAPEKIRSNAVHGLEYFVGGSPERMAQMGRNEQDAYFGKALDWIKAKHGADNVLSAVIHRDETTPHMTVMTIPLDAAGKLNARSFVGNRKQLSEMQTEFADKVSQDFGLRRGIKGSVATHERVRRVYGAYTSETARLELPERARGSLLSRGETDVTWRQRASEAAQDALTGAELLHHRDLRAVKTDLALSEISRDTWQGRAETAEAELRDITAAQDFLFDALTWAGLATVANAAQEAYEKIEERGRVADLTLLEDLAEDPARLQLLRMICERPGTRLPSPDVIRFDTALAASLARHGIDLPADAQQTALPQIRATLGRLRTEPLRDPFPSADDAFEFTQEIEAVLSPADLRRLRQGNEGALQDITPSRLDQLRLAQAYLQQSDAAASTIYFSALRDRLAEAEVDGLRRRSPQDSDRGPRH